MHDIPKTPRRKNDLPQWGRKSHPITLKKFNIGWSCNLAFSKNPRVRLFLSASQNLTEYPVTRVRIQIKKVLKINDKRIRYF